MAEPVRGQRFSEPDFRELFDSLPTAVYTTDADGYVTYFNKAAEELAGRTPRIGEDKWCVSWRLRRADGSDLPLDECPMAVTLKEGREVRDVSVIAIRPGGSLVPVMPFPTLLRDAAGRITGAVNMLVDISALKNIEAVAARRAEEQASLYRFTDILYRAASMEDIYSAALDAVFSGLKCNRAAILLFDDLGVMRFVAARGLSGAYQDAVRGHTPWAPNQRDVAPVIVPDIIATNESEELKVAIESEGIRGLAFIPLALNGGVVGKFMAYYDAPHAFDDGDMELGLAIARQLGFAIERERARQYRGQAEAARHLLSSIVESSEDAVISKDLNGVISSWNKGAERLFGYAPDEIIGQSVLKLIPPEYQHEEPGIIQRIRSGERIEHYETIRRRKDGQLIYISLTVSPVRDATGRIIGASKIARDVSERRRADEQRNLLINELNHRVKNTLATVQSLAMQTLRNTERSEDARALFDSRLSALSRAHDLLTAQNWEGANLQDVVARAVSPFQSEDRRIAVSGPRVRLTPRQALALSIALHELATNAAKYGALSKSAGRIDVEWSVLPTGGAGELQLTWSESGGPKVERPLRAGFGSRLIERSLAHELGGTAIIDYRPGGVVSTISTPLELTPR